MVALVAVQQTYGLYKSYISISGFDSSCFVSILFGKCISIFYLISNKIKIYLRLLDGDAYGSYDTFEIGIAQFWEDKFFD